LCTYPKIGTKKRERDVVLRWQFAKRAFSYVWVQQKEIHRYFYDFFWTTTRKKKEEVVVVEANFLSNNYDWHLSNIHASYTSCDLNYCSLFYVNDFSYWLAHIEDRAAVCSFSFAMCVVSCSWFAVNEKIRQPTFFSSSFSSLRRPFFLLFSRFFWFLLLLYIHTHTHTISRRHHRVYSRPNTYFYIWFFFLSLSLSLSRIETNRSIPVRLFVCLFVYWLWTNILACNHSQCLNHHYNTILQLLVILGLFVVFFSLRVRVRMWMKS